MKRILQFKTIHLLGTTLLGTWMMLAGTARSQTTYNYTGSCKFAGCNTNLLS